MESVEKSIVVTAPVGSVYQVWTEFENFPKFMKTLREVRRIDEKHYHFRSERGGKEYETVAEMSLQIPERRVAWRTTSGAQSSGVVCFEAHLDGGTKISLQMIYAPDEEGQNLTALSERLQSHLDNFKRLIETGSC